MVPSDSAQPTDILPRALAGARPALIGVGLFSAVINLLMLTGPLFMLQVYDRVLASRSTSSLLVLFAITVFLFAIMGLLDHLRGRVLARVGAQLQSRLDDAAIAATLRDAERPAMRDRPSLALADLRALQELFASAAPGALFDLPWTPLFIGILFLFHPLMGSFALGGAVLIFALAALNQRVSRTGLHKAARISAQADHMGEAARRDIETIRALGMRQVQSDRWRALRDRALSARMQASDRSGAIAAATRASRILLQSAILALGAWLVLRDQLTAGAMIAGSVLLGRAFAPVEQTLAHWPQIQRALQARASLNALLSAHLPDVPMPLPRPQPPHLTVEGLAVIPPGSEAPSLRNISLRASAGDAVAVIGPSASGKSSLARALTGLWPPIRGAIRLNGADLAQYDPDRLGGFLGYLPQKVVLLPGTVAENIARFAPDAKPQAIIDAARAACVHDLILALPQGYDTVLHDDGAALSGGQRQRIGLARAFFGEPEMLILDEPNAHLDDQGVHALNLAIAQARASGKLVFVMSHRPSALAQCNLVLLLDGGVARDFGPRDTVLARLNQTEPQVFTSQRGAVP
ncbi:peptide ABC transporter ATPase [Thioclava dalianensis]|uniref:Peptide ABC transporter ATPase n=1 Tax=Thioclava dalianensis TaxID=1185766 RepID=A0A074TCE0_9RHOB|nr:type I secretion system permease/ATPase [Thioclava dalianensis]KEP69456.1 peptide ABC transporter ATPase [Thioclava dalianensis]SFN69345.1 ATP-binding cassette, subfamily C [Thioclava dalianensis]